MSIPKIKLGFEKLLIDNRAQVETCNAKFNNKEETWHYLWRDVSGAQVYINKSTGSEAFVNLDGSVTSRRQYQTTWFDKYKRKYITE